MKNTYTVTLSDGSTIEVLASTNAKARTAAIDHLIYVLGMEKWEAQNEKMSINLKRALIAT